MVNNETIIVGDREYMKLDIPGNFYFPVDIRHFGSREVKWRFDVWKSIMGWNKEDNFNSIYRMMDSAIEQIDGKLKSIDIDTTKIVEVFKKMTRTIPILAGWILCKVNNNSWELELTRQDLHLKGYGDIHQIVVLIKPHNEDIQVTIQVKYITDGHRDVLPNLKFKFDYKDEEFTEIMSWDDLNDYLYRIFRSRQIMPHLWDMLNGIDKDELDSIKLNLMK